MAAAAAEDLDTWAKRVSLDADALNALKKAEWKASTLLKLAVRHKDRDVFRKELGVSPAVASEVTELFYPCTFSPACFTTHTTSQPRPAPPRCNPMVRVPFVSLCF